MHRKNFPIDNAVRTVTQRTGTFQFLFFIIRCFYRYILSFLPRDSIQSGLMQRVPEVGDDGAESYENWFSYANRDRRVTLSQEKALPVFSFNSNWKSYIFTYKFIHVYYKCILLRGISRVRENGTEILFESIWNANSLYLRVTGGGLYCIK